MSKQSIRVKEIVLEERSSFQSNDLVGQWLMNHTRFYDDLDPDGGGLASAECAELETLLDEIGDQLDESTRQSIARDIESTTDGVVQYLVG